MKISITTALVAIVVLAIILQGCKGEGKESTQQQLAAVGSLCNEFKESPYKVSCSEAVGSALADTPGNIERVSIGTRKVPQGIDAEGRVIRNDTQLWLFDIKLEKPYTAKNLNQVNVLRVGISTDSTTTIYREAVK